MNTLTIRDTEDFYRELSESNGKLGWVWIRQFRAILAPYLTEEKFDFKLIINRGLFPGSYLYNPYLLKQAIRKIRPDLFISLSQKTVLIHITISTEPQKPFNTFQLIKETIAKKGKCIMRAAMLPVGYRRNPYQIRNKLGLDVIFYKEKGNYVWQLLDNSAPLCYSKNRSKSRKGNP